MLLAKARVIGDTNGKVRVGLSLPTGFDPEEVDRESVRGNGEIPPDGFYIAPKSGRLGDIFRELEVSFPRSAVQSGEEEATKLKITGRLRRGHSFSANVPLTGTRKTDPQDH
jgi:hypothetical protein